MGRGDRTGQLNLRVFTVVVMHKRGKISHTPVLSVKNNIGICHADTRTHPLLLLSCRSLIIAIEPRHEGKNGEDAYYHHYFHFAISPGKRVRVEVKSAKSQKVVEKRAC